MLTNMHLGAKVTGFNDVNLGTVKFVVIDPATNVATHLVVHEAGQAPAIFWSKAVA